MLEVTNLRIRYGAVEAVKGVSFTVRGGEICGYLGPNGAGKTSTIKAITGILPPHSGQIKVCSFDIVQDSIQAKTRLGYVPDNAAAYSLLTVQEYLHLVGELYEVPHQVIVEKAQKFIGSFGITEVAHRLIETLSKGQRQKVAIIAALLHDPKVLILDEPFNGLDVNITRVLKDVMVEMAKNGRTILFSSHIMEVAERICSRIIIINQGEIVADSPTAKLIELSKDKTLESLFHQLTAPADQKDLSGEILETIDQKTADQSKVSPAKSAATAETDEDDDTKQTETAKRKGQKKRR